MVPNLSEIVHRQTDTTFFIPRVHRSIKAVVKEKGRLRGVLMAGTLSVSSITGLALSYLCLEGVVRSYIEVATDQRPIVRLRYLGDAGGWFSLALFSTLAVKNIFERLIIEGEYIKLKEICQNWCGENQEYVNLNSNVVYSKLNALFRAFQARCLFSKSLVSRRLTVLNILQAAPKEQENEIVNMDARLQETLQSIQWEINEQTGTKRLFHRIISGNKQMKKKGCLNVTSAKIFGVVFPILFLLNFMLSLVGEVGLGKELYGDREELTDVGHFGEWPINAAEALGAVILLISWHLVNQGDLEITRTIYASHIESFKEDENKSLHNRLCEIANEELAQISTTCDNINLPEDYEFEKL